MRSVRGITVTLVLSLITSLVAGLSAGAQTTEQAENDAAKARQRADVASGLVDEAVANRDQIERQLADSIVRLNELTAQLSTLGSQMDRVAGQVGFADVELASIKSDIEAQAVDAYMTVLSSPTVSLVNSASVAEALVTTRVVNDVVADGRATVGELHARQISLQQLLEQFLGQQEQYQEVQAKVDAEVARYTALYEEADAAVASAIRDAQAADSAYRAALSAVDIARAKDAEAERQRNRGPDPTTTTTTTTAPGSPTTTAPATTTSTSGGGQTWNHPPEVERWRGLVQQFFPSHRVEEALRIMDCESNGDPNAVNPYSGASGLFQFLPSTWATTAPKAGYGGYSPFDPEANTASAAWLANRYEELGYYYWTAWSCKRVLN